MCKFRSHGKGADRVAGSTRQRPCRAHRAAGAARSWKIAVGAGHESMRVSKVNKWPRSRALGDLEMNLRDLPGPARDGPQHAPVCAEYRCDYGIPISRFDRGADFVSESSPTRWSALAELLRLAWQGGRRCSTPQIAFADRLYLQRNRLRYHGQERWTDETDVTARSAGLSPDVRYVAVGHATER
jgi:hypothetical protein